MNRPAPRGCLRRLGGGSASPMVRLVCFPWSAAGASVYRRLARSMPPHIDVFAVQLPGRENRLREPRLRRMNAVVDHVLSDVAALQDRPLVLFGHSLGALAAYELALALRDRLDREPQGLVVSGRAPPGWPAPRTRPAHDADDAALVDNLRAAGGTPPSVLADPDMMRLLLPLLRADYEILDTYCPSPARPLGCPVLACSGAEDPTGAVAALPAWRDFTAATCSVQVFEGDHFYLGPQAEALSKRLTHWIDEVCGHRVMP